MCCERCGYDLRTLDVAGVCPECALPIQETRNAAAEPLAADRRAIRRAALVLLIAFAARMAVLALVLLLRWVIDRNVVWPSVISQVLQPWPFDIAVSFAWRQHGGTATGQVAVAPLLLSVASFAVLGLSGSLGGRLAYRYGVRVADEAAQADGFTVRAHSPTPERVRRAG